MEQNNLNISFDEFTKKLNAELVRYQAEYGFEDKVSQLVKKISEIEPNSLLDTLFEKFIETEYKVFKENILHCVRYLINSAGNKLNSLDNVYAMLRMAFDESPKYVEVALATIEELRDKVSLQILIDSINNDMIPDLYMAYATMIQTELENELSDK